MSLRGKISINNNQTEFFSGDNLNLTIEIENLETIFTKEIYINICCETNCQWDDLIKENKEGNIIYVKKVFKDHEILIVQHLTIQAMDILKKGKYEYNVVLNIPQQLAESVRWKYGSIEYVLELGCMSAKGSEILFKMPLKVKRFLNICLLKEFRQPFHKVFKKSFCCGICHTQPIRVILTLPNTSFIAGDSFNYFIKINNRSRLLDLQHISILFTQVQHYKVLRPLKKTKQVCTTLKQVKHQLNNNHNKYNVHGSFLLSKDLIPSSTPTAKYLLNTSYNLYIILAFTRFHTDGHISVPIKIGSHRIESQKIGDNTKYETILAMGDNYKFEYEI